MALLQKQVSQYYCLLAARKEGRLGGPSCRTKLPHNDPLNNSRQSHPPFASKETQAKTNVPHKKYSSLERIRLLAENPPKVCTSPRTMVTEYLQQKLQTDCHLQVSSKPPTHNNKSTPCCSLSIRHHLEGNFVTGTKKIRGRGSGFEIVGTKVSEWTSDPPLFRSLAVIAARIPAL